MLEHLPQWQLDAALVAQPRHQLHSQQRVPAQRKEIVISARERCAQQLTPQLRKHALALALRRLVGTCSVCLHVGCGQRLAIDFAVGRERQGLELYKGRGQHVVGQHVCQRFPQGLGGDGMIGHAVGHQPLPPGLVFARQHHRFADAGLLCELGLDLAQLDAKTPDLHLKVIAPQEFNRAINQTACQIAGLVHAATVEGVLRETLGRQFRAMEVAARHAAAADIEISWHAQRHRLTLTIEQIEARVGNRVAQVHSHTVAQALHRRPDRGLGGAVQVPD